MKLLNKRQQDTYLQLIQERVQSLHSMQSRSFWIGNAFVCWFSYWDRHWATL